MIQELIRILENIPVDNNAIGIEGVPFAGKTFYIENNYNSNNFCAVKEHMLYETSLPEYVISKWPEDEALIIQRQKYFLDIEEKRWMSSDNISKTKVFDRTILSIMGYLYARICSNNISVNIWQKVLNILMQHKNIKLPSNFIFIDTAYPVLQKRFINNQRGCEAFLQEKSTYERLNHFYTNILNKLNETNIISLKTIKSEL